MNRKSAAPLTTVLPLAAMAATALGEVKTRRSERSDWRRFNHEYTRNRQKNRALTKGEKRNRQNVTFIGKPLNIPCNNARTRKLRGLPCKLAHIDQWKP